MADTSTVLDPRERQIVAAASIGLGEIHQMADGRAGVYKGLASAANPAVAASTGDYAKFALEGVWMVTKTTSVVITDGQPVYWDHSANSATYTKSSDRDFFIGTAVDDAASAASTLMVNLNVAPSYVIDLARDGFQSVLAGTPAAGGFGYPVNLGGSYVFELTATNEAQKVDALAVDGFVKTANAIVEGQFRVLSDGAGTAVDFSIGVANETHATDFQTVAAFVALHLDANDVNINAESDDGATDVAPTDTTIDYTEGTALASRVHFIMDFRDPNDVQIYINGALVLGSTTFTLANTSATLFPIVHLEKTSSTDTYKIAVDFLRVRFMETD